MEDLFAGLDDDLPTEESTGMTGDTPEQTADAPTKKAAPKKTSAPKQSTNVKAKAKKPSKKTASSSNQAPKQQDDGKRERTQRPYPIVSFKEATQIGDAIFKIAAGGKVRRLTLLEKMNRNPTSGPTRQLITISGKYGITTGSHSAEWFELTELGRLACDPKGEPRSRLESQFKLAIEQIQPFNILYEAYKNKRLPDHDVIKDELVEAKLGIENPTECIDLFVVNIKDLGLLRTIASSETLISIEQALEELGTAPTPSSNQSASSATPQTMRVTGSKWDSICFYVTAIGEEGSDARKHSDLFLSSLVEPALKELNLEVVRADKIAEPGMITSGIIEHLKHSKLVIADLSLLNPNVFYEMALRHAVKLPIVQIIRKADTLPFDVNQVNSIVIDDSDIYTLIPKLETYRSQIATLAKSALHDPEHIGNPISVFFPDFWK
jgi:hypothetical protein